MKKMKWENGEKFLMCFNSMLAYLCVNPSLDFEKIRKDIIKETAQRGFMKIWLKMQTVLESRASSVSGVEGSASVAAPTSVAGPATQAAGGLTQEEA